MAKAPDAERSNAEPAPPPAAPPEGGLLGNITPEQMAELRRMLADEAAPTNQPTVAPAPLADGNEGRVPVTVYLLPHHHDYLERRAAQHHQTPEKHLEGILRQFRAHYDQKRPELNTAPQAPGQVAGTSRKA